MALELVYETHSISVDNERGIATGWLPGAVQTAEIPFAGCCIEVRQDPRLRECNYGQLNGAPVHDLAPRRRFVDRPYPGGESYRDCAGRMGSFLEEVVAEFDERRVLVIGHSAQRWALRHLLEGVALEDLVDAPFHWREGWEYVVTPQAVG